MTLVRRFFSHPVRRFGLIDTVFALLYLAVFLFIIPPHTLPAELFAWGIPAVLLVAGIVMLTGAPFARRLALWVAAGFLAFTVFLVAALLWTAGYLQGVYGQLGKGFSLITLLAAALVVEFFGLWPYFQLKALGKRDDSRPDTEMASEGTSIEQSETEEV